MPPKPLRLAIDLPDAARVPGGWAPDGSDPKRYPGLYHGHIICLEDGKRLTVLTRYLTCQYGLTPRQYRKRWGLPADYPMSCESYRQAHRQHAERVGLAAHQKRRQAS